jgi:hypothetical protein
MGAVQNGSTERLGVGRPADPERRSAGEHSPGANSSQRVRCRCVGCGAHVHAVVGVRLYGQCGNCGGIDLVPLEPLASH